MSQDTDIQNLFRQFNGQPSQYKEIARTEQSQGARHRWPLLDAIRLQQEPVPPARIADTFNNGYPLAQDPINVPAETSPMPEPYASSPAQTTPPEPYAPNPMPAAALEPAKTSWFRSTSHCAAESSALPPAASPIPAATAQAQQASSLFASLNRDLAQNTQPAAPAQNPGVVGQPEQTSLKSLFSRLASAPETPGAPISSPMRNG